MALREARLKRAMAGSRQILRAGLTGGIASGKSTVASFLTGCGAYVVDADDLAHTVLEVGEEGFDRVVERFGRQILDATGRIDRPALAERVFSVPADRQALNEIVHPLVRLRAERLFATCATYELARLVVLDAALLVETGRYRDFDRLIVVSCTPQTQLERLLKRGLSEAEAQARIAAQAPLAEKLAVADHVIENDGPLKKTERQTAAVYASLIADLDHTAA